MNPLPEIPVRIYCRHFRVGRGFDPLGLGIHREVAPKGGVTVVVMQSGPVAAAGVAVCSMKDSFCKKTGRNLAEQRAVEGLRRGNVITMPKQRHIASPVALLHGLPNKVLEALLRPMLGGE